MLVLDVTVVNVALPDIGTALHLHRSELPWVMTAYTLFFGGLMLLGGRIADLVGPRRLTLIGLAVFTGSSLLCGLSGGADMLLAGRALQGIGAALMSPAALTLFPSDRGNALGVWSALAGVGSALGVILGGVLTSEAGWRWIFTINVPIGVTLLGALPPVVSARPRPEAAERGLDMPGAALVTAGTGAAIYGLINVGSHGWATASPCSPFALALLVWLAFGMFERRTRRPLLAVDQLGWRAMLAGSFLMLAATGLMVGGFLLASFTLQYGHHYSALHVGLAFLPIAVATVAGAQTGSHLLNRVNARIVAVTGLALAAAEYGVAARWTQPVPLVTGLTIATLGIGGDVRDRVHRVAHRRRPGRGRPAIGTGEHLPRTRRGRRRRGPVQRRRRRPRRRHGDHARLRPRLHRRRSRRGGVRGNRRGPRAGPAAHAGRRHATELMPAQIALTPADPGCRPMK